MKPRAAIAAVLLLVIGGGVYVIGKLGGKNPTVEGRASPSSEAAPEAVETSAEPANEVPFIQIKGPLVRGERISLEVAAALLRECGCPQLPSTGPGSPEHVNKAWVDRGLDKVALEFDIGLTVIFTHSGETAEEFVAGMQAMIDSGDWVGHFIPVRNTTAAASEIGENSRIATLSWIEGADIVSFYGEGGQTLADLIAIAESLSYCEGCQMTQESSSTSPRTVVASGSSASCAFMMRFRGHDYLARQVIVEPIPGRSIGRVAVPDCNDRGRAGSGRDDYVELAELPGVSPDVAVVWRDSPQTIFVREGVNALPPEVAELLVAPHCDPLDAPILLRGPWESILGADGKTELDLVPPYDVGLLVEEASAPRYERSHLLVRVLVTLGRPLSREDVRLSLWEGGTIEVTASCRAGFFIAQHIEA